MATKNISDLTLADTLTGSEVIPVVQAGTTKKATPDQIADLIADTVLAAEISASASAAAASADAATATTKAAEASASAASMTNAVRGDSSKTYRTLGGVIRNNGSGWAFISDTAHGPAGMSGALTILADPEGYKLRVPYSFTGAKVVTLVVAPDETFGTRGISVGASVANNEAILQASMNLRFRTSGMTAVADQSTYFGSRVSIAANATNTGFVATVPTMLTGLALPQVSVRAADARNLPVRVKAINSTSFEVIAYSQLQARCYYDGSAWQFTTNNVCGLTASFSAGVLTITHDSSGITNLGAMACQLDGKYEPRISSRSLNSISIRFYNSSGTQVTTADTNMSFEFSRPHEFPALMPTTQACNIDCGRCFLYWADISDANGNFWLHGLLET